MWPADLLSSVCHCSLFMSAFFVEQRKSIRLDFLERDINMGKKSKRSRSAGTAKLLVAAGGRREAATAAALRYSSQVQLQQALAACSFDRLCNVYEDDLSVLLMQQQNKNVTPVSKFEMKQNTKTARTKMEQHLGDCVVAGPLPTNYRHRMFQHLHSMGGMKIIFVEGQGKETSFCYTVGFASLDGGKELLIQDIHRSMYGSNLKSMLNSTFSRHKEGHHLHHGHTVDSGDGVGYLVTAPEDAHEATIVKATRMLETTRLYGVAGYEILILTPTGVLKSQDRSNEDGVATEEDESSRIMTRQEILLSAMGIGTNGVKSLGVLGQGKTKKLEACAFCHQVHDTTEQEKRLLLCGGCMRTFYCCREHQKLDWARHKKTCQLSTQEQEQKAYEPFTKEYQQAVKDGILPPK